jgi:hypothetical protein
MSKTSGVGQMTAGKLRHAIKHIADVDRRWWSNNDAQEQKASGSVILDERGNIQDANVYRTSLRIMQSAAASIRWRM